MHYSYPMPIPRSSYETPVKRIPSPVRPMPVGIPLPRPVPISPERDPLIVTHPPGSIGAFKSYMGAWKSRKLANALAVFDGSWPNMEGANGYTADRNFKLMSSLSRAVSERTRAPYA